MVTQEESLSNLDSLYVALNIIYFTWIIFDDIFKPVKKITIVVGV